MPAAIRILLLAMAVLAGIGAAAIQAEDTPCATAAECNTRGTQAYRQELSTGAGRLRLAIAPGRAPGTGRSRLGTGAEQSRADQPQGRATGTRPRLDEPGADRGYSGKATRYNLEQVALKVDYPSLQGLAGHYLRYAGQAEWESLQIEPVKGGYQASFALMRIGNPEKLMEYGPAAVGELSGRLEGQGALYRLRSEGLGAGCSLLVWQEGIDLRVVESLGGNCQGYGGMGIAAAGNWVKISSQARDD